MTDSGQAIAQRWAWLAEERDELLQIVDVSWYPFDWSTIAQELGTGRSADAAKYQYNMLRPGDLGRRLKETREAFSRNSLAASREAAAAKAKARAEAQAKAVEAKQQSLVLPRFHGEVSALLDECHMDDDGARAQVLKVCEHLSRAIDLHDSHCVDHKCKLRVDVSTTRVGRISYKRRKTCVAACVLIYQSRQAGTNLTFSELSGPTSKLVGGGEVKLNEVGKPFNSVAKLLDGYAAHHFPCCALPPQTASSAAGSGAGPASRSTVQERTVALIRRVCDDLKWPTDATDFAASLAPEDGYAVGDSSWVPEPRTWAGACIHATQSLLNTCPTLPDATVRGVHLTARNTYLARVHLFGKGGFKTLRSYAFARGLLPSDDMPLPSDDDDDDDEQHFSSKESGANSSASAPASGSASHGSASHGSASHGSASHGSASPPDQAAATTAHKPTDAMRRRWRTLHDALVTRRAVDEKQRAAGMLGMSLDEREQCETAIRNLASKLGADAAKVEASSGGGKRAVSPGAAAEGAVKRAKAAEATTAKARAPTGLKLEERDVVLLLHQRGKMFVKDLYHHFKANLLSKSDKDQFIKMVLRVARTAEEIDSCRVIRLKDETLVRFGLDDPAR